MNFVIHYSWLIPLLPLIGAACAGFLGAKLLKGQSHWPIWLGVGASAVLSLILLVGMFFSPAAHAANLEARPGPDVATAQVDGGLRLAVPATGADVLKRYPNAYSSKWYTWIAAGDPAAAEAGASVTPLNSGRGYFEVSAGAWIDPLTAVMLSVVCGIGFLITIFSAGYMRGEAGYFRFFAYLGLFIFAMTCLVMADNLILLYLGWEGVGLCSYLLIGYYYQKPAAVAAAKKAFLVNRVGDFGFAVGIMLIFYCFGTVSYFGTGTVANHGFLDMAVNPAAYVPAGRLWMVNLIPFALMLGAFGKSAQFPLYVWLPDAMEGPTPVSALIHAATMVTAGVYMIARLNPLFAGNSAALITIAVIGSFTALLAGSIALRQFDLKKVLAYSTISQLGYMFVAVAVLAPVAGVFHLVTHAFFKALLFLSAGVVMHAMNGHLDLRKMSGLKRRLPQTRWLMLVGCLALAGFPGLSGFWSKDEIVGYAGAASWVLWAVMLLTAFITAYYTFRLYFRVFEGPELIPTGPAEGHVGHDLSDDMAAEESPHGVASESAISAGDAAESGVDAPHQSHGPGVSHDPEPLIMIAPLALLAVGAVLIGYVNTPLWHGLGDFLGGSPSLALGLEKARLAFGTVDAVGYGQEGAIHWLSTIVGLLVGGAVSLAGIGAAWFFHLKDRAAGEKLAARLGPLARGMEAKYWVDEAYQYGLVTPLRALGVGFFFFDRVVIDGLVWLVGFLPQLGGFTLKFTTQRGHLQGYAATMLFGIAVILLLIFL